MVYFILVKNPAGGWDIQQQGQRKDGQAFHLRVLAPEHVHPVWVKDAADSCLAIIQHKTQLSLADRFKQAEELCQYKWLDWDEYIAQFQGPPRKLPPSWMRWPDALNMPP